MNKNLIKIFVIIYVVVVGFQGVNAAESAKTGSFTQISSSKILKEQGFLFYKNGNFKKAIDLLTKIDPDLQDDEVYILISNCYDSLNNSTKSFEYLTKAYNTNSKNYIVYYNFGVLCAKNKDYKKAIICYLKTIEHNSSYMPAYYNLGNCYFVTNNPKKAKNMYLKAFSLDSTNADVCYNLSLTYKTLNNNKKAEKYLNIYTKLIKTS